MLFGANGKMGRVIARLAAEREDLKIVVGVDFHTEQYADFPIVTAPQEYDGQVDGIIDFSHPSALDDMLSYACEKKIPTVIATTGYDEAQLAAIRQAAEQIPVFFTFNMSLGINLLSELAARAAVVLGDGFDIEIVERHHNQKIDAPSGTAIMLGNAINDALDGTKEFIYDRHAVRQKREKKEIGMHAIRGGTIVGEHEIVFAGHDETISLTHRAQSKEVFAAGSLSAVAYLTDDRKPGLYQMRDLLEVGE